MSYYRVRDCKIRKKGDSSTTKYNLLCPALRGVSIMIPEHTEVLTKQTYLEKFLISYLSSKLKEMITCLVVQYYTSLCVQECFILTQFIKPYKINLLRNALSKVTELPI